ncbi:MAG: hypothetical protein ACYTAF_14165 [Planctomycetota bacterium]
MTRAIVCTLAVLVAAAVFAPDADAQAKNRWRLHWRNDKPKIYTYRHADNRYENYWYFAFEIQNGGDEIVPIILDVMMYTESDKDLMHDVKKVRSETPKAINEKPLESEQFLFGRFYSNVIVPKDVEYKIIERDASLENRPTRDLKMPAGLADDLLAARSRGIIEESIENFKRGDKDGNRWYLNPREMRQARFIRPGQRLHGLAIFRQVDTRARRIELHVSGLIDIIRIEEVAEFETKMHYENNVLKIRYEYKGDEYDFEGDVLVPEYYIEVKRHWTVKKIGPVASKVTVDKLVLGLVEVYQQEKKWVDEGLDPKQIQQERIKHHIYPIDTTTMARTFRLATGMELGYDETKEVVENEKAVWRIHEWWTKNRAKLVWNAGLNRFVVVEEKLPGETGREEPEEP